MSSLELPAAPGRGDQAALARLRWQWLAVGVIYGALILIAYRGLVARWEYAYAGRWLALAVAMAAVQLGVLWWSLGHNRAEAEARLRPNLGYANAITLARGSLLCMLAGFLFAPEPAGVLAWAPAILFTAARLIDLLDGYVARITTGATKLGTILDIEFDGLDLLVAVVLGIQFGRLPVWYLPLAVSRQLFVFGIWWRQRRGLPVYVWPPSDNRRLIAGFQTGFLSVILWPIFGPPATTLAAVLFALPLIFSFGRDWLVVSAVIDAESSRYQQGRLRIKRLVEGWLPFIARLTAAVLAAWLLWQYAPQFDEWQALLAAALASPQAVVLALAALFLVAALMAALGALGRVAAVALIAMACLDQLAVGFDWPTNGLLLALSIAVAHLGSGYYALWQPEERILRQQWGAPRAGKA